MSSSAFASDTDSEINEFSPLLVKVEKTLKKNFSFEISPISKVSASSTHGGKYSTIGNTLPLDDLQASLFLPSISLSYREVTRSIVENYYANLDACQKARNPSSSSLLASFIEKLSVDRGATVFLASWNILPLGTSVFSLPYCVAVGGYIIIPIIFLISIMADITGLILVDCLYAESPKSKQRKRVHLNYVDIARSVWGQHGARLLNAFLIVYLFLGCVVNILLLGKGVYQLLYTYTYLSFNALTIIFSILVYPTLFIRKFTILAYLSLSAAVSVIIGTFLVVILFILGSGNWKSHMSNIPVINLNGFPLAVSIVMLTCVSHSVLPHVEGSMKDRSKINQVLHYSYFVTAIVKVVVASLGSFTFGLGSNSIIILSISSVNQSISICCTITLVLYTIFNYPLSMFIVSEFVDSFTEKTAVERIKTLFYLWIVCTRLILVVLSVAAAVFLPYFAATLGIRGSLIGTCLVFIFPCFFHLKLKWRILSCQEKLRSLIILLVGTLIGLGGLFGSIKLLLSSIKSGSE
ncbi:vesicular inhibitory amino acid transporter [Hydra vulgaris]|uniref:vesicular inhibitory amino acid transporter n=1 Tax=Hydra vulgaris TaxID=6087 RepID=UPI001F5FB4B9|nr:vesicular inhibitory amino acid transporter-like [Hydra vulgaris]